MPFVPTVGLAIVGEEMLRTLWLGGMPWPMRSLAFGSDAALSPFPHAFVAGAGLGGAYALTFGAATTSAVLFGVPSWWRTPPHQRRSVRRALLLGALWPVLTLGIVGGYGMWREHAYEERVASGVAFQTTKELVAIQANIEQALKNAHSGLQILDEHVALSAQALDAMPDDQTLGLLWPETMVLWSFLGPDLARRFPDRFEDGEVAVIRRLKTDVLRGRDLPVFVGALYRGREGNALHETLRPYMERDSLFHLRPAKGPGMDDGIQDFPAPLPGSPLRGYRPEPSAGNWFPPWGFPRGRHDKVQLVPGGETMPLGDVFPILRKWRRDMVPIPVLLPGEPRQAPFQVAVGPVWKDGPRPAGHRVLRVGSVICFDLAFPARLRAWRRDGAQVLFNPANYGWFGPSAFRSHVTAMARLRASEANVTVVMAGNTGPTAFVSPIGRRYGRFFAAQAPITDPGVPAGPGETTFRRGWSRGRLIADPYVPPTVLLGELPWAVLALLLLGAGAVRRR